MDHNLEQILPDLLSVSMEQGRLVQGMTTTYVHDIEIEIAESGKHELAQIIRNQNKLILALAHKLAICSEELGRLAETRYACTRGATGSKNICMNCGRKVK
jgi:hypothetical protein